MIAECLREERLAVWDGLIRGESVSESAVGTLIHELVHDAADSERAGTVLLFAAVRYSQMLRPANRWRLRAVLWYWFSQVGTHDRPKGFRMSQLRGCGLADLSGLYLTWPEVMKAMGRNPNDYSVLKRVEKDLTESVEEEWRRLFGETLVTQTAKSQ